MLSVVDESGLCGAAVQGDDGGLLVSGVPRRCVDDVVRTLVALGVGLPSVRGMRSSAACFVDSWCRRAGGFASVSDTETLYRLAELERPVGVSGRARPTTETDDELLVRWLDAFYTDAFGHRSDRSASRRILDDIRSARGRIVLWTVDDEPVSMARLHAPVAGMARIGPVYTPTEHRGHGYAAAVTSVVADHALRRGVRDVVLFADHANPVANGVYRRLGFVPVADHVRFQLHGGRSHDPAANQAAFAH